MHSSVVTPFADLGQRPVGQESVDSRNSSIKPIEEAPQAERAKHNNGSGVDAGASREGKEVRTAAKTPTENKKEAAGKSGEETNKKTDENRLGLSEEEFQQIQQLIQRDREVKTHEQAHASAGGSLAGSASYEYSQGPDGKRYAVAGEVPISVGTVEGDPKATIDNARQVKRAALAPAEPSSQDRSVAAQASQIEQKAMVELTELSQQKQEQEQQAKSVKSDLAKAEDAEKQAKGDVEAERSELAASQQSHQLKQSRKSFELTKTLIELNNINQPSTSGRFINGSV